ncbi:hypothetical protein BPORC_0881 [Bifidobacterium porcinum]|nr:hypothetical protein BPORC_0881 [Bifidobacterium porcinum]
MIIRHNACDRGSIAGGWKPPAGTSGYNRPRHRHMPAWRTSSDQILPALWSRSYSAAISAPLKSSPALYRRTFSSLTHFCFASLHGTYPVRRFTSASSSGDSRTKSPGMKQNLSERLMYVMLVTIRDVSRDWLVLPGLASLCILALVHVMFMSPTDIPACGGAAVRTPGQHRVTIC